MVRECHHHHHEEVSQEYSVGDNMTQVITMATIAWSPLRFVLFFWFLVLWYAATSSQAWTLSTTRPNTVLSYRSTISRIQTSGLRQERTTTTTTWTSINHDEDNHVSSFIPVTKESLASTLGAIKSKSDHNDDDDDDHNDDDDDHNDSQHEQPSKEEDDDDDDDDTEPRAFASKAKWKKKLHWMMKDVEDRLEQGDYNAAIRKAQELLKRCHAAHERYQERFPKKQPPPLLLLDTGRDPDNDQPLSIDASPRDDSFTFLPPLRAYHLLMHAMAKSRQPGSGKQAETILRQLDASGDRRLAPTVVTYTIVMDAYAQEALSDDGEQSNAQASERILFELLDRSEREQGDWNLSSITIDTVLNAWAQQGTWDAALRAQQILERLEGAAADGT